MFAVSDHINKQRTIEAFSLRLYPFASFQQLHRRRRWAHSIRQPGAGGAGRPESGAVGRGEGRRAMGVGWEWIEPGCRWRYKATFVVSQLIYFQNPIKGPALVSYPRKVRFLLVVAFAGECWWRLTRLWRDATISGWRPSTATLSTSSGGLSLFTRKDCFLFWGT